uniref:ATP synthase F0 subunit 6 n=1 Tax=Micronephthys minuta TaxID=1037237 RepID=UPI0030E027DB
MMTDIFSSFDPQTNSMYSMSPMVFWGLTGLTLLMTHATFWVKPNHNFWAIHMPLNLMHEQATRTFGNHLKGFSFLISSLFLFLITTNLLGLIPYVFSASSHLLMSLTLGLPLWFSLIMTSVTWSPSSFAAHLLPAGAPSWLNPFLVLIETISTCLRPITLSVRLAANMSAGHIVLGLMAIYMSSSLFNPSWSLVLLLITQIFYTLFEVGICLIQAYIFCLLLTLYSDDHPSE